MLACGIAETQASGRKCSQCSLDAFGGERDVALHSQRLTARELEGGRPRLGAQAKASLAPSDGRIEVTGVERVVCGRQPPLDRVLLHTAALEVLGKENAVARSDSLEPARGQSMSEHAIVFGEHRICSVAHEGMAERVFA